VVTSSFFTTKAPKAPNPTKRSLFFLFLKCFIGYLFFLYHQSTKSTKSLQKGSLFWCFIGYLFFFTTKAPKSTNALILFVNFGCQIFAIMNRLYFIDNLRIFLISLVVLHHLSITYGAPGGWYYNEAELQFPAILPMLLFVAANQSFFMGMFFFVSAFFLVPSLHRKGTRLFTTDRLLRLGIPLLFFWFILSPLTVFLNHRFAGGRQVSLADYWLNLKGTGFGPLWFVEALLLFSLVYLALRPLNIRIRMRFPGTTVVLLAAFLTGLLQFIIRIWLPMGWSMPFTSFQLPFFVQYIFLFSLGIMAYRNNWLDAVTPEMGKRWFLAAQVLIFIGLPALFVLGGSVEKADTFGGGLHWQSLGLALWEQFTGFALIIGLTGIFKKHFNTQGKAARQLSDSAYGVFIFHAPVIVALSVALQNWSIFPPLKFIALAPFALIACFLLAWMVKHIPGVRRII
jgi:glucans biosynthesis protein C